MIKSLIILSSSMNKIFLLLFQILLYFPFRGSADGGNEIAVLPAVQK